MSNCLCDIFIHISYAPVTYPDNGIAGMPGRASSKTGLKQAGPENFWRMDQTGPERQWDGPGHEFWPAQGSSPYYVCSFLHKLLRDRYNWHILCGCQN